MGKQNTGTSTRENIKQWHLQGRSYLVTGLAALVLGVGFGAVMLFEQAALFAALGAMGAVVALILSSFALVNWGMRASHLIGNSRLLKLLQPLLLVAVILLWAFPGRAKVHDANCGNLGCREPGIRLRFGMTEEWTTNGAAPLLDGALTLESTRELLFQQLSCVDGFQGIDPVTDNLLDEVDLLLNGTLQVETDLLLTVDVINARTHQRLQSPSERQPIPSAPIEREVALAHLRNNLLNKILRAIDIQSPAPNVDFISRLTTANPSAARLNTEAVELMLNEQWAEASSKLQAATALDPNYATAHNNLGRAYREQQQLAQAIDQYEIATELLPCVPLYHYNLAFAYEEDQQYDKAVAAYKAAIARNPGYTKALNNLGYLYLQQRELATAAQYLDQGLAIDPDDAPLHKNRGRVYLVQGDLGNAVLHLKQATFLFSGYAEAFFFLAEAYDRTNQPAEACAALNAYEPLAVTDARDDPQRPAAAAMRSRMLNCATGATSP